MHRLLIITLTLLLIHSACKKTMPPEGINDPVFMVTYQDSFPVTLTAGQDGIYHFTKYEKVDNEYFYSTNTFSDATCPDGDCLGSLRFEFFHRNGVDSAFSGGQYRYMLPDSLSNEPADYFAEFGWGLWSSTFPEQTFTLMTPTPVTETMPVISRLFVLPNEPVSVSLECTGANGLYSSIFRTFQLNDLSAYPGVGIRATQEAFGYIMEAVEDFSGASVDTYYWSTGDSTAAIFADSTNFFEQFTVTVTDNSGKTASARISNLPLQPDVTVITPQVTAVVSPISPTKLFKVAIQWVDSSGTIWRSDRGRQYSPSSTFEVLESEDYLPNEFGDAVRKLKVRFTCLLYSVDGLFRPFTGEGIIAMARP